MFKHKLFEELMLKPVKRITIKGESGIHFVDINTGENKEMTNHQIARLLYRA